MQVDFVLLCDMANVDGSGKLNMVGEFNAVPTPPLRLSLVTRIMAAASEGRDHRVGVAVVDADGNQLARLPDQAIQFSPVMPGTSGDLRAQLVIGMQGVRFPRLGTYSFHVLVDGRMLGDRELYVVPVPQGPAVGQAE
jgi:hypothetical protein